MNARAPHPTDEPEAPVARRASGFAPAVPSSAARVLIVDDDDEARSAAASALRALGCTVDEVRNGVEALRVFQNQHPHIVLLEVMTPFVDGYSICRSIRDMAGGDEATIVLMTDANDVESLQFGYEAGATDFITKPINASILQHRIRYMLRAVEVMDQLRRSERRIAHIADHDALTGLPNRRSLTRYMRRFGQRPAAERRGAMFLLDLDGFKRVNDTFGHTAGDELICEVGRRIAKLLEIPSGNPSDPQRPFGRMLARLGGDEFVLVDPDVADRCEAETLANHILGSVAMEFELRGHPVSVTASIGVALIADVGDDAETLVQSADTAMYDAKAHDRNTARFYSPELRDKSRSQLDVDNALRQPNALDQLELFYQPKVDVRTEAVVGAEALLRWRHPELGLVSPADFIPIAEETGLIVAIGRWVLGDACRQIRKWQDDPEFSRLRVAVNVSARQFRDPRFLDDVERILAETGADPRSLELEITEGTLMNDTKSARQIITELRRMGLSIALDDFGTGYSSLGYLRQFPFDTLKIDRSFVSDLLVDEGCEAITGAIIAMANRLGLAVVAEGVETKEHVSHLLGLGCDQVQGYFYSRPVAAKAFEAWAAGRIGSETPRMSRLVGTRHHSAIPPLPSNAPSRG